MEFTVKSQIQIRPSPQRCPGDKPTMARLVPGRQPARGRGVTWPLLHGWSPLKSQLNLRLGKLRNSGD